MLTRADLCWVMHIQTFYLVVEKKILIVYIAKILANDIMQFTKFVKFLEFCTITAVITTHMKL